MDHQIAAGGLLEVREVMKLNGSWAEISSPEAVRGPPKYQNDRYVGPLGPLKGFRIPLKGFGVDVRQVQS